LIVMPSVSLLTVRTLLYLRLSALWSWRARDGARVVVDASVAGGAVVVVDARVAGEAAVVGAAAVEGAADWSGWPPQPAPASASTSISGMTMCRMAPPVLGHALV
jgi:hypothetical protein